MKLPEVVVMSVRALISAIEADPVKQETSYQRLKEALLGSYGKTKCTPRPSWTRRPPPLGDDGWNVVAQVWDHRSGFAFLGIVSPPFAALHSRSPRCGEPHHGGGNGYTRRHSLGCQEFRIGLRCVRLTSRRFSPLRFAQGQPLSWPPRQITQSPRRRRPPTAPPPHPWTPGRQEDATFTEGTAKTPQAAANPVTGQKTRSPPWATQCSRRPHLSSGFGFSYLKNWPKKGLCGGCFICLRPLPSYDPILPPFTLYTCMVYTLYSIVIHTGGGGLTRKKVRGAIVHKPVENNNMTDYISSL